MSLATAKGLATLFGTPLDGHSMALPPLTETTGMCGSSSRARRARAVRAKLDVGDDRVEPGHVGVDFGQRMVRRDFKCTGTGKQRPSLGVGVTAISDRSKRWGRGTQMTGSPWELTLVLLVSAAAFLSLWHFVAQIFG
jgi:hypothetical protein